MLFLGSIPAATLPEYKSRLIRFAKNFELGLILDSNTEILPSYNMLMPKYDFIAGFARNETSTPTLQRLEDLKRITARTENWYLGYLSYDLKNRIENLKSENPAMIHWPDLFFFQPELLFVAEDHQLRIYSSRSDFTMDELLGKLEEITVTGHAVSLPEMKPGLSRENYLTQARKLQDHIQRGDIYEVNFCMEFYNHSEIDPYTVYLQMKQHAPAPFSAFLRHGCNYLISASPERFLRKENNALLSQPIKGTAARGRTPDEDEKNRNLLKSSLKERTENIMITDLVRNDLSRIASQNSVSVDELCGIYAYPHVHQMISTVRAELTNRNMEEVIRATFPMGSMTGAPKIRAMELIEEYENMRRGLYSGAVGYIGPGMDFDLNVVIRSLQYNSLNFCLSYMAGSALTALADPEKEYEECLLKVYAMNSKLKEN